jgi:hypothetical protein
VSDTPPYSSAHLRGDSIRVAETPDAEGPPFDRSSTPPLGSATELPTIAPAVSPSSSGAVFHGPNEPRLVDDTARASVKLVRPRWPRWGLVGLAIALFIVLAVVAARFPSDPVSSTPPMIPSPHPTEPANPVALPPVPTAPMVPPQPIQTAAPIADTDPTPAPTPPIKATPPAPTRAPARRTGDVAPVPRAQGITLPAPAASTTPLAPTGTLPNQSGSDNNPFPAGTSHF